MHIKDYIAILDGLSIEYLRDVDLSKYCTYGTGGKGKIMVFPKSFEELKACLDCDMPAVAIGFGSNLLFSDYGYDGVIVNTSKINKIEIRGSLIVAQSGAMLSKVSETAEYNCLSGLEFTEGIPATVGGAVCMNAGCFSKSVSEYVSYVVTNKAVYNNASCNFSYRSSIFDKNNNEVIYSVGFVLKPSEIDIIESKKERFKKLRKSSQPHGKSCGSVFLNDGYFAGKVIDVAGLKGYAIGGAKVSEKHANFIINTGKSSNDIYKLIKYVKNKVYETQNIKLKEELRYVGRFDD